MPKPISESRWRKLKRDVEQARTEAERAAGALQELKRQLATDFQCQSLAQARALSFSLERKIKKAEQLITKSIDRYEKKWKQKT